MGRLGGLCQFLQLCQFDGEGEREPKVVRSAVVVVIITITVFHNFQLRGRGAGWAGLVTNGVCVWRVWLRVLRCIE